MSTRFFYDVGSPYAWLAAERVGDVLGEQPEWVPVLLGGIFRATGGGSWAETPARDAGIAEIERRAAQRGLSPVRWPEPWPNDGLRAMRAATAAHREGRGPAFALVAMRLQFAEGRPMSEPDAIAAAARRAGLDGEALLAQADDPAVKQALREQTEGAVALGVRGVPTVARGDALFWGDDRLEDAAHA